MNKAGKLGKQGFFNAVLLFLLLFAVSVSIDAQTLGGKVSDQQNAPIENAKVEILDADSKLLSQTLTDGEGNFSFREIAGKLQQIKITARGFADLTAEISGLKEFSFILRPAPVTEEVLVTASRTANRLGETPQSVVVLSERELSTTAAATLDDALRQVPGFSLFRRSGSRTSNPTTGGVSLRGVGASGASRTLILSDGVPLNDPFGGWVQWGRVPRVSVGSIEVLRGGASSLYGSSALSGVVNIIPKNAEEKTVIALETSGGNQKTLDSSIFLSRRFGKFSATLAGEAFHTKGYIPIEENERGAVDSFAGTKYKTANLTLEQKIGENARIFARASTFGEARTNGTGLQINRTHIRNFSAGFDWQNKNFGAVQTRIYGGTQVFDQTFSAVSAARTSENLIRIQRVPAQIAGVTAQWSGRFGSKNSVVAGFEAKETRGFSDEIGYAANRASSLVGTGGKERSFGAFFSDFIRFNSRFSLSLSGRIDRWKNSDALSATRSLANNLTTTIVFADRNETAFSPQAAAQVKLKENLSLNFSVGRSFRAPTLNELYRAFRVGNILTLANENLRAEKATSAETGFIFTSFSQKLYLRGTAFWTKIANPVANVTLTTTPNLITRQRRNLGENRARGAEIEAENRFSNFFTVSAGYLFTDSTIRDFPANPALVGRRIPQVARHQATFQTRLTHPANFTFAAQGRLSGAQFEDDLNQFRLERFFNLDVFVSQKLRKDLEIFTAIENVFNSRYSIGRTPLRTLNSPTLFRLGLRWNFSRK